MAKESELTELVALMVVLRDRGVLTEEDMQQVSGVSDLTDLLVLRGLIDKEDLQERSAEVAQLVGELVSALLRKPTAQRRECLEEMMGRWGLRYRKLFERLRQSEEGR